ncbi:MAG: hypothetical protein QOI59_2838 [Gammaproteobacteria bacterium]|nr:hypothetical protein [Gammaproteobacteria bacterium]
MRFFCGQWCVYLTWPEIPLSSCGIACQEKSAGQPDWLQRNKITEAASVCAEHRDLGPEHARCEAYTYPDSHSRSLDCRATQRSGPSERDIQPESSASYSTNSPMPIRKTPARKCCSCSRGKLIAAASHTAGNRVDTSRVRRTLWRARCLRRHSRRGNGNYWREPTPRQL